MDTIIIDFFAQLINSSNSFVNFLGTLLENLFTLIYVPATVVDGSSIAGHFTTFGLFSVTGLSVTLVFIVARFVKNVVMLKR